MAAARPVPSAVVSHDPYRLPRTATPLAATTSSWSPTSTRATFRGTVAIALEVHERHRRARRATPSSSTSTRPGSSWPTAGAWPPSTDARREPPSGSRSTLAEPLEAGPGHAPRRTSGAPSTTSCAASTAPPSTTTTAHEQVIATTQMQATDCRRAFPCWDEPDFKAVFGVTLVVADDLLAISNGPEVERRARGRRQGARPLRRHDADVDLPGRLRRRPAGGDRRRSTSTASRCASCTCPARSHLAGFALEIGAFALRLVPGLLRHPLPRRQGRPRRPARLRRRRHGEPRLHHVPREPLLLVDPATATQRGAAARRRRRRPRAGPHVVRRPRHDALVERHLAERGLRHLHGGGGLRRVPARLEALGRASASSARPPSRSTRCAPPARSSSRSCRRPTPRACSTCSPTRRAARCCACWSSTSARSASATASATTCTQPQLRQHRDQRPVGRHRGARPASRCAASWTRWIWQGGYPLVVRRSIRRRPRVVLSQHRFLFDGDDDGTRWAVPGARAPARRRPRPRRTELLLDGDEAAVALLDPDARRWSSTPAATASTASPTTAELLARLAGPALASCRRAERYSLVDDAWAAVVAGAARRGRVLSGSPRASPTSATSPCGRSSSPGCGWCGRFVEGDARERVPGLSSGRWSAPALERPRLGAGGRRGRPHRRAAGHAHPGPGGARRTTPPPRSGRARCTPQADGRPGSRRPRRWPPPRSASWPPPATTPTTSAAWRATSTRRNPQEQLRYLFALAEFPDADLMTAHAGVRARAGRQDPERPLPAARAASPTATTARWRGGSCASTGTEANAALPEQRHRAHGRHGQDAHPARGGGRRRRPSSPSTRSRRRPRPSSRSSSASGSTWRCASGPRRASHRCSLERRRGRAARLRRRPDGVQLDWAALRARSARRSPSASRDVVVERRRRPGRGHGRRPRHRHRGWTSASTVAGVATVTTLSPPPGPVLEPDRHARTTSTSARRASASSPAATPTATPPTPTRWCACGPRSPRSPAWGPDLLVIKGDLADANLPARVRAAGRALEGFRDAAADDPGQPRRRQPPARRRGRLPGPARPAARRRRRPRRPAGRAGGRGQLGVARPRPRAAHASPRPVDRRAGRGRRPGLPRHPPPVHVAPACPRTYPLGCSVARRRGCSPPSPGRTPTRSWPAATAIVTGCAGPARSCSPRRARRRITRAAGRPTSATRRASCRRPGASRTRRRSVGPQQTWRTVGTMWGRWSPGRLSDRCFVHLWPSGQ